MALIPLADSETQSLTRLDTAPWEQDGLKAWRAGDSGSRLRPPTMITYLCHSSCPDRNAGAVYVTPEDAPYYLSVSGRKYPLDASGKVSVPLVQVPWFRRGGDTRVSPVYEITRDPLTGRVFGQCRHGNGTTVEPLLAWHSQTTTDAVTESNIPVSAAFSTPGGRLIGPMYMMGGRDPSMDCPSPAPQPQPEPQPTATAKSQGSGLCLTPCLVMVLVAAVALSWVAYQSKARGQEQ